MTHQWVNRQVNCCHQGNVGGSQGSLYNENRYQNSNHTKAYLNPHLVNYELVERSLSCGPVQGGNKIHVNPNFRGKGLSSIPSYPHLMNTLHNSPNIFLSNPTTSKVEISSSKSSVSGNNKNSGAPINSFQSLFKKVNAVSVKSSKSLYSWSKSKVQSKSSVNLRLISNANSEGNAIDQNYNHDLYKYTSPKKLPLVCNQTTVSKKNHSIYKSKTKIINESKTKLINNVLPRPKLNFRDRRIQLLIKRQLNMPKFTYNKSKKSSVSKMANAVRSKYKYLNNQEQFKKSKYKIDKRNKLPDMIKKKSNANKIKDITKLFPNSLYNRAKLSPYNIYNLNTRHIASQSVCLWRKDQPSDIATQKLINNKFLNKRVIKIGGILYKSTANKLILANKKGEGEGENISKKTVTSAPKAKKQHVVYVRGEKFILENNGKALRRQSVNISNEKALLLTPKRIDIGGVTYIQKSQNVLIRTNVHQARHLVNKAKNKSIALLAKLHKRSSMPCMIYHRFGICNRHTEGLCMYRHDPKNIAVCKKFLKGNCTNDNCLLSHEVVQEKMATCHFFLKGLCVRENCPFLHVKLNKKAAICENFIQGFCNLGKECSKRHLHQCPEFDKTGTCNLGSKCPYPHKKFEKVGIPTSSENAGKPKDELETLKYYVHSGSQKKQKSCKRSVRKAKQDLGQNVQKEVTKKDSSLDSINQSSDTIKCFPKRVKLDKLPCFIPLNSD